jgi:peptide deformylase
VTATPIRLFGDPVLRSAADPVVDFDKELRQLVTDLTDTMRDAGGVGLAAPQIGVSLRVFSFDVDDVLGHLINPVLHFPDEEEQEGQEGCLSIPGLYYDTKRRQNVVAKGFNSYGDPLQIVGTGLMARCVQHETDHLDGVLFLDRLDPQTRKQAMKEIREAEWYGGKAPVVKLDPHGPGGTLVPDRPLGTPNTPAAPIQFGAPPQPGISHQAGSPNNLGAPSQHGSANPFGLTPGGPF